MLLLTTTGAYSQESSPNPSPTKQDYLKKSRGQKTAAWILLGSGATLLAIAAPGEVSFDILPVLVIGGTAATLGSIPLFIASGRNKRKAMRVSSHFEIQKKPVLAQTGLKYQSSPAVSIKINF